ncbi:hypothetical protein [Denitrobaculum tricleocarpae]|uniref:Uncharacterized protein n=1 Tax=Denitrobaculum tricleocarpae TaxID=2591009 RepID=A0A545TP90_9PROT|nr:hypothetical protein [Denitrobaculum tricleocarpae]TQV79033.1 hypothetical protein FKG95_15225 [Denitrobaculum tricleocarpae]
MAEDEPVDREALLQQLAELRATIDPEILKRVQQKVANPGSEPYDKKAARQIVEQFLAARYDNGAFARRLMEELARTQDDRTQDDDTRNDT